MNIERLKHLITVLSHIPADKFDLDDWRSEGACGTVACAVGWACMDPEFNRQGLQLLGRRVSSMMPCYVEPAEGRNREYNHWDAVTAFFDLDSRQAFYLFSEATYDKELDVTPATVILRIEGLISSGGALK